MNDGNGTRGTYDPTVETSLIERLDRLLRPARTTGYPIVLLVMWPILWFVVSIMSPYPIIGDFAARWTGGRMITLGEVDNLYDPTVQMDYQKHLFDTDGYLAWFVGPPFEAVMLAPFSLLPYEASAVIWTAASATALALSLLIIRQSVNISHLDWRRFVIITIAAVPTLELLLSGQSTSFVLLWLALSHRSIKLGRPFLAGIFLGLALVKPHLILLLPALWILDRRWMALAGLATSALGLIAISCLAVGPDSPMQWLEALGSDVYVREVHEGQTLKNGGLMGLLTPWLPETRFSQWQLLATIGSLAAGLAALTFIWLRNKDATFRWWLSVFITVAVAPHAMVYDLILVIPAIGLAALRWWTPLVRVLISFTWVTFWIFSVSVLFVSLIEPLSRIERTPWPVVPLLLLGGVILTLVRTPPVCQPPTPSSSVSD